MLSFIIAENMSRARSYQGNDSSSKKRKSDIPSLFAGNWDKDEIYYNSISRKYVGKRILLMTADIYPRGRVPADEEDMLFQYYVVSVNRDFKTAVIAYDDKCIREGGDQFMVYPDTTGADGQIDDYSLKTFDSDEKRYNVNLGRTNKIINDLKDAKEMQDKEDRVRAKQDCSDLQEGLNCGKSAYPLLLNEFAPVGGMQSHVIRKGSNTGKTSYKQTWSKCVYAHQQHTLYTKLLLTFDIVPFSIHS